jgi:uncharacterized membrane protein YcaP (DUF421 family)
MTDSWHSMFALSLPWAEKMIRPLLVYLFLLLGFRLAGKRELSPRNPMDFVVLLIISNAVQNAMIGDDNSVTGGLIGGTTLLVANYLTVRFLFKHPPLEKLLEGKAKVLISKGKLLPCNIEKELLTEDALEQAARKEGIEHLGQVWTARLETDGSITFITKPNITDTLRHAKLSQQLLQLTLKVEALTQQLSTGETLK